MDELEAMVGSTKTTTVDLAVEAGKVEEFARATHNTDPAHRDAEVAVEHGFDDVPAPPTFLMTAMFPRYTPEDGAGDDDMVFNLGFDLQRVLHGEQVFEYERPITVDDELHGETELTDVYQREGDQGTMTFAIQETEFTNNDGDVIAREEVTIIEQGGGGDE